MKIEVYAYTLNGGHRVMRPIGELEVPPGEFLDKLEVMSPFGPLLRVSFQLYPEHPAFLPGAPIVPPPGDES